MCKVSDEEKSGKVSVDVFPFRERNSLLASFRGDKSIVVQILIIVIKTLLFYCWCDKSWFDALWENARSKWWVELICERTKIESRHSTMFGMGWIKVKWLRSRIYNVFCWLWHLFKWRKSCSSCPSNKCWGNMFWSNVNSKFLYFVGKVFDEKTGKVSTRVDGLYIFLWMSDWECINYLMHFFTGRCQSYSFSIKLTFSCVHNFLNLVLCLSVQVFEKLSYCFSTFSLLSSIPLLFISSSLIDSNNGEELWL